MHFSIVNLLGHMLKNSWLVLSQQLWNAIGLLLKVALHACLPSAPICLHFVWIDPEQFLCSEGDNIGIPLRNENSTVSCSLHDDQLCISVLITIYCQKKLLWWWLQNTLIYGDSSKSLGVVFLIPSQFNRMMIVGSPKSLWPI